MSESTSDSGNLREDTFDYHNRLFENYSYSKGNKQYEINEIFQITNNCLFEESKAKLNKTRSNFSKISPIPKPDFSTIEKKESSFQYKKKGMYKKPKSIIPESPMKSPNQNYFTPGRLNSNLFPNKSTCRKLNFAEINESPKEQENILQNLITGSRRNSILSNLIDNSDEEDSKISLSNRNPTIFFKNFNENNYSPNKNIKPVNLFEKFESMNTNNEKFENSIKRESPGLDNHFNEKVEDNNKTSFLKNDYSNYSKSKEFFFFFDKNINLDDSLNTEDDFNNLVIDEKECQSKFENEFQILNTIESGSFGIVYKCLSLNDKNIYAIKRSKKAASKLEVKNTKNLIIDMSVLAKYNNLSNFVVKYKEAWMEEDLLFIKQEFCKYGDLLDFFQTLEKNEFNFTTNFYWDIIFQMICGLKYVHDSGYVHLDIKPSNFFVGKKGFLKLGDFNLTQKKNKFNDDYFEGDSIYMAPEILAATKIKNLNEKCDIFSLGLTIVEILFKIELPQNGVLWHQLRNQLFIIPDSFLENTNLQNIPKDFFDLIYGMIHHDPNLRFDIDQIFTRFPEIKFRMELLNRNLFKPTYLDFILQYEKKFEIISLRTSNSD